MFNLLLALHGVSLGSRYFRHLFCSFCSLFNWDSVALFPHNSRPYCKWLAMWEWYTSFLVWVGIKFWLYFKRFVFLVSFSISFCICVVQFRCSSNQIPKNLVSCVFCIVMLSTLICISSECPCFWKSRETVFSMLSVNLFTWNHFTIVFISSSMHQFRYLRFLCDLYNVVSSANNIELQCWSCLCRSLVNMMNISGPRHDPWGVPKLIALYSEYCVFPVLATVHLVLIFLLVK